MLCDAFVAVLKSGRLAFNGQFEHARRAHPALEGPEFAAFLESSADPVVHAASARNAAGAAELVRVAYDLGLELVGQRLAGPRARHDWIDQAWRRVLCANAAHFAADPLAVAAAVSNAVHHVAATPGARPGAWIEAMEKIGPAAASTQIFLRLGQVLAWRCGLAQYRAAALDVAATLPEPLVLAAVDAPRDARAGDVLARLRADPWHVPGRAPGKGAPVARVGAFRGFGGLFTEPPRVAVSAGQLFVHSGADCWLLAADAFGATFHRATPEEAADARPQPVPAAGAPSLPHTAGEATSLAATDTTIAVTGSLTHQVLLYARDGRG